MVSPSTSDKPMTYHMMSDSQHVWISIGMIMIPLILSILLALPIPLMHLTHTLQPIPEKWICADISAHLTFDVTVLILGFALPAGIVVVFIFGVIVRYSGLT